MYFKLFKPQDWRKRSVEVRRRNCAVLPKKYFGFLRGMRGRRGGGMNMRPDAILQTLERAGFEARYVGGCVRDTLLGRPVHDWDIAPQLWRRESKNNS